MIIKSLSWKVPNYRKLGRYIVGTKQKKKSAFIVCHNMLTESEDADDLAREIEENGLYASYRKNGLYIYHEMVSLSPLDRAFLTPEILTDMMREYLAERLGDCGLGFAGVHQDKDNIHFHCMIGANQIKSRRKLRMSKKDFDLLKIKMSGWLKEKYPQLVHTYDHRKRKPGRIKERQRENRRNYRLKQQGRKAPSKKELARAAVVDAVKTAKTAAGLFAILGDSGYQAYKRGKSWGVVKDGLRFRLSTLGVLEMAVSFLETVKRVGKHLAELDEIQSHNAAEMEIRKELDKQGMEFDL